MDDKNAFKEDSFDEIIVGLNDESSKLRDFLSQNIVRV